MQISLVGPFCPLHSRRVMVFPDVYAILKDEIVRWYPLFMPFCHDATSSQILYRHIISKRSKILIFHFKTNKY